MFSLDHISVTIKISHFSLFWTIRHIISSLPFFIGAGISQKDSRHRCSCGPIVSFNPDWLALCSSTKPLLTKSSPQRLSPETRHNSVTWFSASKSFLKLYILTFYFFKQQKKMYRRKRHAHRAPSPETAANLDFTFLSYTLRFLFLFFLND